MPEKKFARVSFAAKPITIPITPAEANHPVTSQPQPLKIRKTHNKKIASFPILSKRGSVLC